MAARLKQSLLIIIDISDRDPSDQVSLLERCSDIFLLCIGFDNVSAFSASPSDAVLTEAKSKAANYCYFRASKRVLNLDHAISFPLILYGK